MINAGGIDVGTGRQVLIHGFTASEASLMLMHGGLTFDTLLPDGGTAIDVVIVVAPDDQLSDVMRARGYIDDDSTKLPDGESLRLPPETNLWGAN